jgi:flagellar export protein FliJ
MFKFRLERVLGHRERLEKEAKNLYIQRKAMRLSWEQEIAALQERRNELSRTPVDSVVFRMELGNNFSKVDDDEKAARISLEVLKAEEEAAEMAWIHAKKELQVIQKLRDNRKAEWDLEDSRKAQNALDEWATLRRSA